MIVGMRNMSNLFYKYLTEKIINFFSETGIRKGDKFYFLTETEEQVNDLYHSLKMSEKAQPFSYIHDKGNEFQSFVLEFGKTKLLIAATINGLTPDYLVTIRNLVGAKDEKWENTALLSISHKKLDSVAGGGSGLQKEGMPLHVHEIKESLAKEIDTSELAKNDKVVLHYYLQQNQDDYTQKSSSVFDYEDVLSLIQKKKLEKRDYADLGFFYDSSLDSDESSRVLKKRLEENKDLFEKVDFIHTYGDPNQDLERWFDDRGINKLKDEDWNEIDYRDVKLSFENNKKSKPLQYIESNKKENEDGLTFWERADKDTTAGNRKRHIIVFNPSKHPIIQLNFKFNEFLKSEFLVGDSTDVAAVSGKQLKLAIPHTPGDSTFKKVVYKHNNETKSNYEFRIAVLECEESLLNSYKTSYFVNVTRSKSSIQLQTEDSTLLFNKGYIEEVEQTVSEQQQVIAINQGETKVSIGSEIEDSVINFKIARDQTTIPISVQLESRVVPYVTGRSIWKMKREKQQHFTFSEDGKLVLGTNIYTPKDEIRRSIELEKQMINEQILHGEVYYDNVRGTPVSVQDEVLVNYGKLVLYYKKHNTIPSLAYMDEELTFLVKNYLHSVVSAISKVAENDQLSSVQKNLSKLGVLVEEGHILLTPLHPLVMAYQLKINQTLKDEVIETHILNRLTSNNLLPYFIFDNNLFKVKEQQHSYEWIYYGPYQEVSNEETKLFTEKLVSNKLKEFVSHFSYLFSHSKRSPLKINLINLESDLEYLQGIFRFLKSQMEKVKDENEIIPVEVTIYQKELYTSTFENLSSMEQVEKIENAFNLNFTSSKVDKQDILRIFREKLLFSKKIFKEKELNYAHLSFYKMGSSKAISKSLMKDIPTGLSLGGLLSGVPTFHQDEEYRSGFGAKYISFDEDDMLLNLSTLYNEFICNMDNYGSEPYRKGVSIVTRMSQVSNQALQELYQSCNWVTFIDPKVDLEYFKSGDGDLIVIHYSDQHNSPTSYDSITVTGKTDQYKRVIEEFLGEYHIQTQDTDFVIKWFNVINGEWLLKLIGNSTQFPREKLSIISAIKYGKSYLYHKDIMWIPISMEEILRVSSATGLNKEGGVFSAKNLNVHGEHSDDILFIGVEFTGGKPNVHFFPVEVKIGLNQSGTINKAQSQIKKTRELIIEHTKKYDEEGLELFKNKFYRNFFLQLFLTNAGKFKMYGLISQQEMDRLDSIREMLLNDHYEISDQLKSVSGECGIITFTRDTHFRTVKLENEILRLDLTEQDALKGIVAEVDTITNEFIKVKSDLTSDFMPYYHYKVKEIANDESNPSDVPIPVEVEHHQEEIEVETSSEPRSTDNQPDQKEEMNTWTESEVTDVTEEQKNNHLENDADGKIEVLFGTNLSNQEELYWKPTDTTLISHPNTGIIGTMGTGKTQFTKSLVAQLVRNSHRNVNGTKIGILIFDYKGDYISEDFLSKVNGKKYDSYHLPYNPLSLTVDKNSMHLLPLHTARGITTTLEKVFGLGDVQSSILLDMIMEAYERKGIIKNKRDTWENEPPTFSDIFQIYKNLEDTKMDKLYKALRDINDFEIFESDASQTVSLFQLIDGVTVINLQGYDEHIQNLIVAMTLDLFYTQMQLSGDSSYAGNYRELRKFVLVDEADNFMSKNFDSLRKILKEGRSFGVGTILSTQFLNHFSTGSNEYADYILSWIVHNVTDIKAKDVKYIFNTITNEETENILQRIKQLQKHESIIKLGNQRQPVLIRDKAFWELELESLKN